MNPPKQKPEAAPAYAVAVPEAKPQWDPSKCEIAVAAEKSVREGRLAYPPISYNFHHLEFARPWFCLWIAKGDRLELTGTGELTFEDRRDQVGTFGPPTVGKISALDMIAAVASDLFDCGAEGCLEQQFAARPKQARAYAANPGAYRIVLDLLLKTGEFKRGRRQASAQDMRDHVCLIHRDHVEAWKAKADAETTAPARTLGDWP